MSNMKDLANKKAKKATGLIIGGTILTTLFPPAGIVLLVNGIDELTTAKAYKTVDDGVTMVTEMNQAFVDLANTTQEALNEVRRNHEGIEA